MQLKYRIRILTHGGRLLEAIPKMERGVASRGAGSQPSLREARDPARRVLRPGREELAVTDPVARRSASLRGASGEGSAGPEPKIATVERREASVSRETQGASQGVWRAALRHARGCPSTRAFSRRSATPHSGARSKKAKPGRKNAPRERRNMCCL